MTPFWTYMSLLSFGGETESIDWHIRLSKVLNQVFAHSYSHLGPMQPHPEFNSPGDCQGHCGPRVILALILRDFGHLALPLNSLESQVWKAVGNFNTRPPFNHRTIRVNPPPTHIPQPEHYPTPSYLVSFYKMFVFSSQTFVCKWQMPQS